MSIRIRNQIFNLGEGTVHGGGNATPDGEPSGLTLTVLSDTSIKLDWTRGSTNNDGTSIERTSVAGGGSGWSEVDTVTGATVTFTDTGLTASTTYYYRVREYIAGDPNTYSSYSSSANSTTMSAGEAAIRAGNTYAWYDASDATTITKDGSNYVSAWNDKLGSAHNLAQGTASKRPVWSSPGIITFDGSDDALVYASGGTISSPHSIYLVIKQITWTSGDFFMGMSSSGLRITQTGSSPNVQVTAGYDTYNIASAIPLDTYVILRIQVAVSGNAGKVAVNEASYTSTNLGSTASSNIAIGARYDGIASYSNSAFKEVIVRTVADDTATTTAIYNYLATKYGFTTI